MQYENLNNIFPGIPLDRIPDDHRRQLLIDVAERYKFHLDLVISNSKFYGTLVYSLSLLIPIYSAILTFIISSDLSWPKTIQGLLGLGLTILTIISNSLKPYEKYITACNILIRFRDWRMNFIESFKKVDLSSEDALYELLKTKDGEISEISKTMLEQLTPTVKNP
jgi:hypothetical protein